MPEVLPADLEAVVGRVTVPDPRDDDPPEGLTGELGALHAWWTGVSDGSAPRAAIIESTEATTATEAVRDAVAAADRPTDAGATLLIPHCTSRAPVAAMTIVGLMSRTEPPALVDQPRGMSDRDWMARCAAVRDGVVEVAELRAAPVQLLTALEAVHIAFVAGVLLGASARRTPSLVEGTDELAAALVADRLSFRAREWWRAGSTSPDPARLAAVERLDLAPGLPLGLTDDDGRGAAATVALLALLAAGA